MMKILYIRPNITKITGGVKVNEQIYEEMRKIENIDITIKEDDYYWRNIPRIINRMPSFVKAIMFNFRYLAYKDEFRLYDYLFVDSRLYPRLFIFLNMINKNIKIITTHHHL